MSRQRTARTVLGWLVIAFLVVQVVVPAIALLGPRPVRFGWHMYTVWAPTPSAWTESADGTLNEIDLRDVIVAPRPEMDLGPVLRDAWCGMPDVEAIIVVSVVSGRSRLACP